MINKRERSREPIFFMDKDEDYRVNPIYMIDEEINTRDRFVIMRTTDNGKWIRGGMLYFKLDKVQIFTDINNAIFVDLRNSILFVKEQQKVMEQIKPVDPEHRQYIILMYCQDGEYLWEAMEGRQSIYDWIKTYIDIYEFDPKQSIVLTENVALKDAFTVSKFIKYLQNSNLVEDDGFDIDQYEYEFDQNQE